MTSVAEPPPNNAAFERWLGIAQAQLTPPSVAVPELVRLMNDERTELRALGRCVASDPILAADALRVANSVAFAAATGQITDCVLAVVRLGEELVCSLVAARLRLTFGAVRRGTDDREWRHALNIAIGARALARLSRFTAPSLAFTAGLLSDLGKLVLAEMLVAIHTRGGNDVAQLEGLVHRADPFAVGARAARLWKIPEPIPSAIEACLEPMNAKGQAKLPAMVMHAARAIVLGLESSEGRSAAASIMCRTAYVALKLDDATIEKVASEIDHELKAILKALGLSETA